MIYVNHIIVFIFLLSFLACEKKESVVINAPLEAVWAYVGNSDNAKEWSVYFSHIKPIAGPDGQVGGIRRCFRRSDETKNRWDEKTLELKPMTYRKIHTYGLQGFPDESFNSAEFHVHQRFDESADKKTVTLSFGSELLKPSDPLSLVKFLWHSGEVSRVISLNLKNIKEAIESRHQNRPYVRPHPYELVHAWDQK
jgi:hypothetical protein